jgi:hypothetical protein
MRCVIHCGVVFLSFMSAHASAQQPLTWHLPDLRDPALQTYCDRLYLAVERLAHHLQAEAVHPWASDSSMALATESKSQEHWIRPNTGIVAGLAFLYRFGPYDAKIVGLSREDLLARKILPMMRYLAATHVTGSRPTGDGKPWGDAWQSAHWTHSLAMASWWLGADLPADVASRVREIVAHEADRIAAMVPPHQLKLDTKAEENAWNSQVLSAAVVLMPTDPRRATWEGKFQEWVMSSFLRPADERSAAVVDGQPVSVRFKGANIYDDFTLENHRIVHPDYMTAFSLSLGCTTEFALTGRRPPEALQYNVAGIYENLKWFSLPDGGFVYPSGQDWPLFRQVDWLYPHLLMAVFARDPEAWPLADRSLGVLEKMRARSSSGAVYLPGENFFASAHADKLFQWSMGWLGLHFADRPIGKDPRRQGVRRFENARMIVSRTPSAVHSLSWGTGVMIQAVPMQKDRLVSPHERSGVGAIKLEGAAGTLPVTLIDAQVSEGKDDFAATLTLHHGDVVRAGLQVRSNADGSLTIAETLVALRDATTVDIATGLIGVLNDKQWIYERAERRLRIGESTRVIPSGSGEKVRSDAARTLDVDGVLSVESAEPLRVRYLAAREPARSRMTDELAINVIEGRHQWTAGEVISRWEATIRCRPTAAD